jgi:hypothetical protein
MRKRTLYGNVLTGELAQLAFREAFDAVWTSQIAPIIESYGSRASITEPTGFGLGPLPPRIVDGDVQNGQFWLQLPPGQAAALIYDLFLGKIEDGIYLFQTNGSFRVRGPFNFEPNTFDTNFKLSLLRRTFDQNKKRLLGQFKVGEQLTVRDYRRVPLKIQPEQP